MMFVPTCCYLNNDISLLWIDTVLNTERERERERERESSIPTLSQVVKYKMFPLFNVSA